MKNLYCLLFISGLFFFLACFYKSADFNFLNNALKEYDMSSTIEILGYDPRITVYNSTGSADLNEPVTVYVHGLGESQNSISFFKENSDLLPGTIIGFNFKNTLQNSAKMPIFKKTNFYQSDDIKSLLMILKTLDECGVKTFHLFGSSSGGGVIITTIARLCRYDHYVTFFKKLGFNKERANRILQKIKIGTVVLNCPLIDINQSIKHKLIPYGARWLSPFVSYGLMPLFTNYSPTKDSPIRAAKYVQKLDLPLLIHFQKNNLIIGNHAEALFYNCIKGSNTHLVLGDNGGHFHLGETLAPALHFFRKKYNGPCLSDTIIAEKEYSDCNLNSVIDDSIDQHISDFYRQSVETYKINCNKIWQKKFFDYDVESMITKLGYDPKIRLYQADKRTKDSGLIVYVHGYGDNYAFTIPHFLLNSYFLPGDVVGFNFQDVTPGAFKLKVGKSSVGQTSDIASLAMVLKVIDESGLEKIHLFGYSRGGATIVTTLGRFCDYVTHKNFFDNLEIHEEQVERIITKIKAGTIVLNCPLVDTRSVARHQFGSLDKMVMNTIVPKIMEHHPDKDQALDAAKLIQSMNFKILVHFQKNDAILGNTLVDAVFYNNLKGEHTYLVIANEGGHMHTGETLNKATQAFRKKYNAGYYPFNNLIEQGNILLKNSPRTTSEVNSYVSRMYV